MGGGGRGTGTAVDGGGGGRGTGTAVDGGGGAEEEGTQTDIHNRHSRTRCSGGGGGGGTLDRHADKQTDRQIYTTDTAGHDARRQAS